MVPLGQSRNSTVPLPLLAPVRRDNRGYLETKRRRAGHLFDDAALLPQADG